MPQKGETTEVSLREINSALSRINNALDSEIGSDADDKKFSSVTNDFAVLRARVEKVYLKQNQKVPPDLQTELSSIENALIDRGLLLRSGKSGRMR